MEGIGMGYTTVFSGEFRLDKPLTPEHCAYLAAFNRTRRVQRNAEAAEKLPDPVRIAAGLPIGEQGGFFVGSTNDYGQGRTPDITDYNSAPAGQSGLWCKWMPNDEGTAIEWDQGEKFYDYVEWIEYLIEKFLKPWGYVLNGTVEWSGEKREDLGKIVVADNVVTTLTGSVTHN
jgi:hypothetical protein